MRYGLFISAQHTQDTDVVRALEEHLEQVRYARDSGFSSVFAGQHFLSEPFQMLQPAPLLARIAADSGDMIVGAGIFLASLLNPVELAEQVATLDVISGGRFVFGVGLGYREEENMSFDMPKGRVGVFEDKLDVVRRLLEGERVTATGHGYRLDNAKLSMRPTAKPRPPIWMAANGDAAVKRAAMLADTWFVNPHASIGELERQIALFRDAHGTEPSELPAMREVCIRRTDEEAIEVSRPFLDNKYKSYISWGQSEALPATDTLRREWDELRQGRFIIGSPTTALEQIQELEKRLGVTHLICRVQWPGLSHEEAMETLRFIKCEVVPSISAKQQENGQ